MTNCCSIGIFFVIFLGLFCLWNCVQRDEAKNSKDWYGCLDQAGKQTDFFTIYKLPHEHKTSFSNLQEGTAYIYLTPDSATRLQSGGISSVLSYSDSSSNWVLSNVSIDDDQSMPGRTLRRLYKDSDFRSHAVHFMYNDEFPNGTISFYHGHTKGVVVLSELGGYWIIHSVPKYPPPAEESYSYPSTAHRYGQTMLCISLPPLSQVLVENIARQLIENDVKVYSWNIPSDLASKYPVLQEVKSEKRVVVSPFYRIARIQSALGKSFTSFAKYRDFDEDLYSSLIAPVLKTNLYVESWRNGPHPLPSSCNTTYVVQNIESVEIPPASLTFSTHRDHSKWAVSQDPDKPYVCIGDINRMETQFKRGGGAVCIWSVSVWYRFKNLIRSEDGCPIEFVIF